MYIAFLIFWKVVSIIIETRLHSNIQSRIKMGYSSVIMVLTGSIRAVYPPKSSLIMSSADYTTSLYWRVEKIVYLKSQKFT